MAKKYPAQDPNQEPLTKAANPLAPELFRTNQSDA